MDLYVDITGIGLSRQKGTSMTAKWAGNQADIATVISEAGTQVIGRLQQTVFARGSVKRSISRSIWTASCHNVLQLTLAIHNSDMSGVRCTLVHVELILTKACVNGSRPRPLLTAGVGRYQLTLTHMNVGWKYIVHFTYTINLYICIIQRCSVILLFVVQTMVRVLEENILSDTGETLRQYTLCLCQTNNSRFL